jgi:transcriptional regulator
MDPIGGAPVRPTHARHRSFDPDVLCPVIPMRDGELHVLRESLDLLILKALTTGPKHGYAVAEWIERATGTVLFIDEGTLYPALHRLARRRLVSTEWGLSENNRTAKYYTIAPAGRTRLRAQAPVWHRYADGIARALRSMPLEPA